MIYPAAVVQAVVQARGMAIEEAGHHLLGQIGRAGSRPEAKHRAQAAQQHEYGHLSVVDDEMAGLTAGAVKD